jgi:uncharacterized repeat protein (TIGR01451 family)
MKKKVLAFRLLGTLGLVLLGVMDSGLLLAQPGPDLTHVAIECIPQTQFAILMASIRPGAEIHSARVYFRSDKYPDFYYIDMEQTDEAFQAILPKPSLETEQVIYYIEAVDIGFSSNRTEEHISEVAEDEDECRRRQPAAAYFVGGNPEIMVGALKSGMPPVPAGFLAEGIAGFIPLSSSGGGAGATTAIAVGAGAAGAAGVGVLAASGGGDTSTTTTTAVVSPPPPPPPTTTSVAPSAPSVVACYHTTPNPAIIEVGEQIKLDARCSEPKGALTFKWDLGDGREKEGSFIAPKYWAAGTFTVTLTVRRTTSFGESVQSFADEDWARFDVVVNEPGKPDDETPPEAPAGTDLSVTKSASAETFYPWQTTMMYTITVQNLGPTTATGVTVVDTLPEELEVIENPGCLDTGEQLICEVGTLGNGQGWEISFEMDVDGEPDFGSFIENRVDISSNTADPNPTNNTATVLTPIGWALRTSSIPFTATSFLRFTQTAEPSAGNVVLNGGRVDTTMSGVPFQHRFEGRAGRNTIEANQSGAGEEGLWRFDFSGAQAFVAGSFRVEVGEVVSRDTHAVVFRMSGTAGERIRFSFELSSKR